MGRRRPPPPSASPVLPSSKAKDYTTHRGSAVQDELDELRNQGVAKFMNQHFTETSKRLAKEKAEADAALADLERRRANTSEFVPSKGGELNPYDTLYLELQQRRADCRRKEKETMLLYQRYVHKFKKKAISSPASPPLQPQKEEEEEDYEKDEEFEEEELSKLELSPASTPIRSPPPPSPLPGQQDPPGKSFALPVHPLQSLNETEEGIPESTAANLEVCKFHEAEPKSVTKTVSNEAPASTIIVDKAESQEDKKECLPDVVLESLEETTIVSPVKMEEPELQQEVVENDKQIDREIDAKANDVVVTNLESGIALTEEERPLIEVTGDFPSPTTAEEMEDDDYDQSSIISGLTTVNSALMGQVMEQLQSEMQSFIKDETEAIQKILDAEEANSYVGSLGSTPVNSAASVVCDQSVRASMKAEAMAEEMRQILENFDKEDMSVASKETEEEEVVSDEKVVEQGKQSAYPLRYNTSNPKEEWMVYWDEKYQREYYHDKRSKATQWEPPSSASTKAKLEDFSPVNSPSGGLKRRLSRSDLYRRKLRKRRRRRIFAFAFLAGLSLISALHWRFNHADKPYSQAMKATAAHFGESVRQIKDSINDKYEYIFTDRAEREEALKTAKEERERRAKDEAIRQKLEQEAEAQKEMEKLQREKEALRKAQEEERKRQLAAQEEQRLEAEERAKEEAESKRRTAACNLPLSYAFNRRCRLLARINPIYTESQILNSFIE